MSVDSNGRLTAPSADRMRLQLDNMLEQRSAAEAFQAEVQRHRHTQGLLDAGCNQLRIAKSEVDPTSCLHPLSPTVLLTCRPCSFSCLSEQESQKARTSLTSLSRNTLLFTISKPTHSDSARG